MDRNEYDAHPLQEADITLHRDPEAGVIYVTVEWLENVRQLEGMEIGDRHGLKFAVSEELMTSVMGVRDPEVR